jgi:hypothetical protein
MRSAKRPHRPEAEFFADPQDTAQRRYEALRAYFLEGATAAQAAARFGYAEASVQAMVRDFRAGDRGFFIDRRPGPRVAPPSRQPATRSCGCAKPAMQSPRSPRPWPPPPRR